ncbi:MAG: rhodanese-like domain-containing protein [Nitrospirota bacterium]
MRRLLLKTSGASLFFCLLATLMLQGCSLMEIQRVSKENLKAMIGQELTIIDVRTGREWDMSSKKITGSVREDPDDAASWASKYPKDRKIVLYCA